MTDADLKEYLQKRGDRFALRDFLTDGLEKPKTRKASLMDRLRDTLRSSRASYTDTSNEETESVAKKSPSAKKRTQSTSWLVSFRRRKKDVCAFKSKSRRREKNRDAEQITEQAILHKGVSKSFLS